MPLAELAAVLAEYKVVNEDVEYVNFHFQVECVRAGYLATFIQSKLSFCEKSSENGDDASKILVDVESFVKWAYGKQILLPNEFLVLIGKGLKGRNFREAELDKHGIQVIARVLWDLHRDWTQEQIKNSVYVQVHGCGSQWPDKTIRKWIAEVDPRDSAKKTGPKKKCS